MTHFLELYSSSKIPSVVHQKECLCGITQQWLLSSNKFEKLIVYVEFNWHWRGVKGKSFLNHFPILIVSKKLQKQFFCEHFFKNISWSNCFEIFPEAIFSETFPEAIEWIELSDPCTLWPWYTADSLREGQLN